MSIPTEAQKPILTYLVREPKIKIEKPPVLILLHGVGSNEKDLFSFADELPDRFLVISARGPITLGPTNFAWYQVDFSTGSPVINATQEEQSRKIILEFIDQLKQFHSFDESQIYLGGFSQGAIMSYSIGLIHPEKIKGIVILSGRLIESVKPLIPSGDKLNSLKVFISHGTEDSVLKIGYAREASSYLKSKGIECLYKEYPVGHTINGAILNDLINWLNK